MDIRLLKHGAIQSVIMRVKFEENNLEVFESKRHQTSLKNRESNHEEEIIKNFLLKSLPKN